MSAITLGLFFWGIFKGSGSLGSSLFVTDATAILAAISLIATVILYLWAPRKHTIPAATSVYLLLVATTSVLILQSGGIQSPFIALWLVAGVFSGIFGWWGIGGMLILANAFITYTFFFAGTSQTDVIVGFFAATLPVVVSYLLWNDRDIRESSHDHAVKKLNKTLEQESSKSDAIIQAIGDGVIVVKQTGEITLINPAAQKMTGWTKEDAINLHYQSVLKLEDEKGNLLDDQRNPILKTLNTLQEVRNNNVNILTKSGKKIVSSFTVAPLGAGGEGAIAVFRDVTKERKEEREQAEFISTASHEMRTPVASIEGYLGLALNPSTAQIDEKAREYINKAHESAQHLGHLFQDLLDISKAEDGRLQSDPKVIDMVSFGRDILESLTPQATKKGLEVVYRPDGTKKTTGSATIAPMLYTHVDKNHLREVVSNLIENAIKYTPQGKVQVDVTAANNDYVRITIEDSGIGIPEEDVSHLFQKFYRVDNSDTREINGTGLGLYLTRRLVESMNGRIWVESEYGRGSRFYIELPRLEHSKASRMLEEETRRKQSDIKATPASTTAATPSGPATPPPAPPSGHNETSPANNNQPPQQTTTPQLPSNAFGAIPYGGSTTPTPPSTPIPMPTVPPELTAAPTPAETMPPAPTPTPTTPQAAPKSAPHYRQNTPLSTIERSPERYTVRRQ